MAVSRVNKERDGEILRETPEEVSKKTPGEIFKKTPEGVSKKMPGEACREASQEIRKEMRKKIRRLRQSLEAWEKARMDRILGRRLLELPAIREAEAVYLYASLGEEPDTWEIFRELTERGVRVAFPRVSGNRMEFFWTESRERLEPGAWGILEPDSASLPADAAGAPVVVPGLAFTRSGRRLGYGGGYYDRFLAKEPEHERIALAYPFQIVEELPTEAWDVPVCQIVTIEGTICGNRSGVI